MTTMRSMDSTETYASGTGAEIDGEDNKEKRPPDASEVAANQSANSQDEIPMISSAGGQAFESQDTADVNEASRGTGPARLAPARVGEVLLLMMTVPRYWHMSVHDLDGILLQPLLRNQIAVAYQAVDNQIERRLVGAAIWARVSESVDMKIRQQIKESVFPVRLKPDEWQCGELVWLLDVIAPTRKVGAILLAQLSKSDLGLTQVNIHPRVAQSVDISLFEGSKGTHADGGESGAIERESTPRSN